MFNDIQVLYQILLGVLFFSLLLFIFVCFAIFSINSHLKDFVDLEYKKYKESHEESIGNQS